MKPTLLHATCITLKGKGVLISGQSGAGKSSLALQLIDRGALLVSDDQTFLSVKGKTLIAQSPPSLKGLMEVRGVGICPFPYQNQTPITLWVDICKEKEVERLPTQYFIDYNTIHVPYLKIKQNDPLSAIKVELKVRLNDSSLP